MTVDKDIFRLEKVSTIQPALTNKSDIIFPNIAFVPRWNSNLISLG